MLGVSCVLCAGQASAQADSQVTFASRQTTQGGYNCLVINNENHDTVALILKQEKVIQRAGSWRGREGRYLLFYEGTQSPDIEIRSFSTLNLTTQFLAEPCPSNLSIPAARALSRAMNQSLKSDFGEPADLYSAEQDLQYAATTFANAGDLAWAAHTYYELGALHKNMDDVVSARTSYQQARQFYVQLGDQRGIAASDNSLGLVAWREGDLDQALEHFYNALEIRETLAEPYYLASIYNNLGLIAEERGYVGDAISYYESALSTFQGAIDLRVQLKKQQIPLISAQMTGNADLLGALNTLNNLAVLYDGQSEELVAERYWRNCLLFADYIPVTIPIAQAKHNLGRMLLHQGRLDESLMLLSEAYDTFVIAQKPRWEALTLTHLSYLYAILGDKETAQNNLKTALSLDVQDTKVVATLWRDQATLYRNDNQLEKAKAAYTRALYQYRESEQLSQLYQVQSERAYVEFLLGNTLLSLAQQRQSLEKLNSLNRKREAGRVLSHIAQIYHRIGEPQQAEAHYQQALALHRRHDDLFAKLETLERLSHLYADIDPPRQISIDQQIVTLAERLRGQQLPPLLQAQFFATRRAAYQRLITTFIQRDEPESAWLVAERARARSLMDLRHAHEQAAYEQHHQSLLDERAHWIARQQQLRLTQAANPDVQKKILHAQLKLDRVATQLQNVHTPRLHPPPKLEQLQRRLTKGQRVLSYYLGAQQSYLWVVSQQSIDVYALTQSSDIETRVNALLATLKKPETGTGGIYQHATALSRILLAPATEALAQADELIILADGALHLLPFALLTVQPGQPGLYQPLATTHSLRYTPAVGLYSATKQRREDDSRLLIMADPVPAKSTRRPIAPAADGLFTNLPHIGNFAALPGTRREAEAIMALTNSVPVHVRLGKAASRDFILNNGLNGYAIVHIATHGLSYSQHPRLSALLLNDATTNQATLLYSHEIAGLNLDTELVVLSGCETGTGKVVPGEGAFSLARPFLIAGAKEVLSSLWKINDGRTALFMERFYHHLLNEKRSAAQALAKTQQWARQHPQLAHPHYWAGFVLSGGAHSGEPLALADNGTSAGQLTVSRLEDNDTLNRTVQDVNRETPACCQRTAASDNTTGKTN